MAWEDADPVSGDTDIFFRRSTDAGQSWIPVLGQPATKLTDTFAGYSSPLLIAESGSNVYVAWSDVGGDLLLRRSADGGNSFSAPVDMTPGELAQNPALLAVGSAVYFAYVALNFNRTPFPLNDIFLRRSFDGGATWDPTPGQPGILLSGDAVSGSFDPRLVSVGSSLLALWTESQGPNSNFAEIAFRRSTDGGVTFAPQQYLSHSESNGDVAESVAVVGSSIYAAWVSSGLFTGPFGFFRRSTDEGATWLPSLGDVALDLSFPPLGSGSVQAAADGGNVYVAASSSCFVCDNAVLFRRSQDGGVTWQPGLTQPPQQLLGGVGFPLLELKLAASGGNVYLASLISVSGRLEVIVMMSSDGGQSWGSPQTVSSTSEDSSSIQLGATSQSTALVWSQSDPTYNLYDVFGVFQPGLPGGSFSSALISPLRATKGQRVGNGKIRGNGLRASSPHPSAAREPRSTPRASRPLPR